LDHLPCGKDHEIGRVCEKESRGVIHSGIFGDIIAGMPRRKRTFRGLSMTDAELMAAALIGLEHQRSEIAEKMAELRRQLGVRVGRPRRSDSVNAEAPPVSKKRTMSAAGRRRVAAAQR